MITIHETPELSHNLLLDLLGTGELVGDLLWELFGEPVLGDADGFVDSPQGILDIDLVPVGAEDEADAGIFMGLSDGVVEEIEVEIHLAGVLGLEGADLQLHGHETGEPPVIEEQVDEVVLFAGRYLVLIADEGKSEAELEEDVSDAGVSPPAKT